jgi:hypothetical protein
VADHDVYSTLAERVSLSLPSGNCRNSRSRTLGPAATSVARPEYLGGRSTSRRHRSTAHGAAPAVDGSPALDPSTPELTSTRAAITPNCALSLTGDRRDRYRGLIIDIDEAVAQ